MPHDIIYPILAKLDNVQRTNDNQWSARCPIHDDSTNSLGVSTGKDGRALLHCHACGKEKLLDIMIAVNAKWTDLHPQSTQAKSHNKRDSKIVAAYDYHNEHGRLVYQSCRMDPKDFRQRRPDPDHPGEWLWNMKGVEKVPYRLPDLIASESNIVFIVEGEKDVDNVRSLGLTASCNVGGAGKWLASYNQWFNRKIVYILQDNDTAGEQHAHLVAKQLHDVALEAHVVLLPGLPEKGDVSDWIASRSDKTKEDIKNELMQIAQNSQIWKHDHKALLRTDENSNDTANTTDPFQLAREYLKSLEHENFPGKYTIRHYLSCWHQWTETGFIEVPDDEFKANLTLFIEQQFQAHHEKELRNHAVSNSGRAPKKLEVISSLVRNVILAITSIVIIPANIVMPCWIDQRSKDDFISCENGIVNLTALSTDSNCQLSEIVTPHTPDFFCLNHLPFPYVPNATLNTWKRFLEVNIEGDENRIMLLQEWFGYCLTRDTSFQKFLMMEGEGANGKSVICAVLSALLGDRNVSSVPLEIFPQRFALTDTVGKNLNIASEIGELDKIAEGLLKQFTAGDRMMFDRKNKEPINAVPTAKLILATNNLPRFKDHSDGIWRRMILFPLKVQIPAEDRVQGMDKASWWREQNELSGILNWAIEGLVRLRSQGKFTSSEMCDAGLSAYRRESNPAREFLSENYHPTSDKNHTVKTKDVYRSYRSYCEQRGFSPTNDANFSKEVYRTFPAVTKKRVREGVSLPYVYDGLIEEDDVKLERHKDAAF